MLKKTYAIRFIGLLEQGYVRSVLLKKGTKENIRVETEEEVLNFATKYRFKWYADFLCWMYNYISERNYTFRTYYVVKL